MGIRCSIKLKPKKYRNAIHRHTHLGSLLGLEVEAAGFCDPDLDEFVFSGGRDEVEFVREEEVLVDDESLEDEGALETLLDDDDVVLVVRLGVASLTVRLEEEEPVASLALRLDDEAVGSLGFRLDEEEAVASLAVRLDDDDEALDGALEEEAAALVEDLTLDDEDADGLVEDEDLVVGGLDLGFPVPPVDLGFFSLSLILSQDQLPLPSTTQTEII